MEIEEYNQDKKDIRRYQRNVKRENTKEEFCRLNKIKNKMAQSQKAAENELEALSICVEENPNVSYKYDYEMMQQTLKVRRNQKKIDKINEKIEEINLVRDPCDNRSLKSRTSKKNYEQREQHSKAIYQTRNV